MLRQFDPFVLLTLLCLIALGMMRDWLLHWWRFPVYSFSGEAALSIGLLFVWMLPLLVGPAIGVLCLTRGRNPRRRFWQFSLAGLLLSVPICAAVLVGALRIHDAIRKIEFITYKLGSESYLGVNLFHRTVGFDRITSVPLAIWLIPWAIGGAIASAAIVYRRNRDRRTLDAM